MRSIVIKRGMPVADVTRILGALRKAGVKLAHITVAEGSGFEPERGLMPEGLAIPCLTN